MPARTARPLCLLLVALGGGPTTGCRVDSNPATNPQAPPAIGSLEVVGCDLGLRVQFVGELDPKTVTTHSFFVENVTGHAAYDLAGRSATFAPDLPFTAGNTYHAILTKEITSIGGTNLEGMLDWAFACTDRTPPAVVARTPIGNGVSPLVQPTVTFSKAINLISITPQSFSIAGALSAPLYDVATNTVTLAPGHPLYPGRTYAVTVGPSVQDVSGNALGVAVNWSFQTRAAGDDWAVRVIAPPIPSAAPCDTPLEVRLAPSFEVDVTLLATSPFTIDGVSSLASSYDSARRVLLVSAVDTPLRPMVTYSVISNGGLRDTRGDRPFDDGSAVVEIDVVGACTTPTVARVPDASGTIACAGTTSVTFSVPMDPVATAAALSLQDLTAGGYDPAHSPAVMTGVAFDATGKTATLSPAAPLINGHRYWLAVSTAAHDRSTPSSPLAKAGGWELTASCP